MARSRRYLLTRPGRFVRDPGGEYVNYPPIATGKTLVSVCEDGERRLAALPGRL